MVTPAFRCVPPAIAMVMDWLGLSGAAMAVEQAAVAASHRVSTAGPVRYWRARTSVVLMPVPPALPAAVQLLDRGPSGRLAADAAAELLTAGLAVGPLPPAAVYRAASLFGLHPRSALRPSGSGTVVVAGVHLFGYDQLPRLLRATVRRRGLIRTGEIPTDLPGQAVRAAMRNVTGLTVHGDWCWIVGDHSQICQTVDRLLAVCGPLAPAEILAGLQRATRLSPATTAGIPPEALLGYLASQPGYELCDGKTALTRSAPVLLTTSDQALADAFDRLGDDQLSTAELVRALSAGGLSPICAHNLISLSPLLRQVQLGVQELRGTPTV